MHGGRCAQAAGSVQPAPGLGVHVPPGPGGLDGVLLVLRLDVGAGHVEGPGLVGVDSGHPGVHGLHVLEVGGAGGGGLVDLADGGGGGALGVRGGM